MFCVLFTIHNHNFNTSFDGFTLEKSIISFCFCCYYARASMYRWGACLCVRINIRFSHTMQTHLHECVQMNQCIWLLYTFDVAAENCVANFVHTQTMSRTHICWKKTKRNNNNNTSYLTPKKNANRRITSEQIELKNEQTRTKIWFICMFVREN